MTAVATSCISDLDVEGVIRKHSQVEAQATLAVSSLM